jgi:hypothetical protein
MRKNNPVTGEVKKLHLEAVVLFAINNIPQVDPNTLKQFLELVTAGGSFGSLNHEQILTKMNQVLKYIPDSCSHSLLILMDLLEIKPPEQFMLAASRTTLLKPGSQVGTRIPLVLETSAAVTLRKDGY